MKICHQYLFLDFLLRKDIIFMINKILGSKRLTGMDRPSVWSLMTTLAVKTNSINLVYMF